MVRRLYFSAIVLFWVVMNVLLWRSELGGTGKLASTVPMGVVWQKILTAPDDSALGILHQGKKIGYCRWRPHIAEALPPGGSLTNAPEGQIKHLTGYTIDLEGSAALPEAGNVRFNFHGAFGVDHRWQKLVLRAAIRPWTWEIQTVAGEESFTIGSEIGDEKWQRRITYAELRDPGPLLAELGIPVPPMLLLALPQLFMPSNASPGVLGVTWTGHLDGLKLGHSQIRVYRLEASLLDRYRAVVLVSRVGELLKVELPSDVVLINDALSAL